MALWVMLAFGIDKAAFSLTVQMTSYEDDGTIHRLPEAGKGQISTYVEAVDFLLKSYATYSNTAKAASEIPALRKTPVETSVQFADVFCTKFVCCGNV